MKIGSNAQTDDDDDVVVVVSDCVCVIRKIGGLIGKYQTKAAHLVEPSTS